jgi:hypothetical protein
VLLWITQRWGQVREQGTGKREQGTEKRSGVPAAVT